MIRPAFAAALLATAALAPFASAPAHAACPPSNLDGAADNERDDLDYFYVMTGGLFPNGNIPNGDNASGGTFRYLVDDPYWGYPTGTWRRDDWFPQNAGFALTLREDGVTVYDNNGIDAGTHGGFYDSGASSTPGPGLYRGYVMSNNFDFAYATFFRLTEETTIDEIVGYYDGDGYYGDFDATSPELAFRVNVWSAVPAGMAGPNVIYDPACATYRGDVLTIDSAAVDWSVSDTGVARVFPPSFARDPDPIWRMSFRLGSPVTLPAGEYFFNLDALVHLTVGIDVRPNNAHNQVNTSANQLVPVAILSNASLDAPNEVDVESVEFRGAHPLPTSSTVEDVNADGLDDLVVRFRARSLADPSAEECANPALKHVLTGSTIDARAFSGSDTITFTGPACGN